MYLETSGKRYPCSGAPSLSGDTLAFVLPEGGPEALGETVALFMDDGFPLCELAVSGYARWYMAGDTLTITNLPESEPAPDPGIEPPHGLSSDSLAAAMVDLMYELDTMKLQMGGTTV